MKRLITLLIFSVRRVNSQVCPAGYYDYTMAVGTEVVYWSCGSNCAGGTYTDTSCNCACQICGVNSYSDASDPNRCMDCVPGKVISRAPPLQLLREGRNDYEAAFHDNILDCVLAEGATYAPTSAPTPPDNGDYDDEDGEFMRTNWPIILGGGLFFFAVLFQCAKLKRTIEKHVHTPLNNNARNVNVPTNNSPSLCQEQEAEFKRQREQQRIAEINVEMKATSTMAPTTYMHALPPQPPMTAMTAFLDTNGDGVVNKAVNVPLGHQAVDLTNDGVANVVLPIPTAAASLYGAPPPAY